MYAKVCVCVLLYTHWEDKSFDLLDLSCLKTVCGVAEYRKVRFTWPGQRSILYTVLKSATLQCSGGVANWSCLSGFYGGMGAYVRRNKE